MGPTVPAEEAFRQLADGLAGFGTAAFFDGLVTRLASLLELDHLLIAEMDGERARTLAVWSRGALGENFSYSLVGTPCETVIGRDSCLYASAVTERFPDDQLLRRLGAESYLGMPIFAPDGSPLGLLAVMSDRAMTVSGTARELLRIAATQAGVEMARLAAERSGEENARRLHLLMNNLPGMAYQCQNNRDWTMEFVSAGATALTGYRPEELIGNRVQSYAELIHPEEADRLFDQVQQAVARHEPFQVTYRLRTRSGRIIWAWEQGQAVYDADGRVRRLEGFITDITEQHESQRIQHQLAYRDTLTGLPNRAYFMDALADAVAREAEPGALVLVDLKRFKEINDTQGHQRGDALLVALAERLRQLCRDDEQLARIGGDEFALVCPGLGEAGVDAVEVRLERAMAQPFELDGRRHQLDARLGIACYPQDGDSAATLLQNASIALSQAKQAGQFQARYHGAMTESLNHRQALVERLTAALAENRLGLHYQPVVRLGSGELCGAEALCRWYEPDWGWISPGEFIPLAEERGLMPQLTDWVVATARRQWQLWQADTGAVPGYLAVNLSAGSFEDAGFADRLLALTEGVAPTHWVLELTESDFMREPEQAVMLMRRLTAAGFGLAIDDFGTGYSSLAYLKRFSADRLKIDMSFVRDMLASDPDKKIVTTIIAMARSLGMKTVAEGVETRAQADTLRALGCDQAQGFLFGRPIDPDDFARQWLG